ncbi:uncharacterized protein LOC112083492 [Eutrema salsugineum]|uniref:uncharacterized protein LOC112083492 n=1 Tax=Eutrema salsugineum TaxID=72664 RepID=UPI000CED5D3D|nr:uncharacterized protein LOC112083492 [Eutrema salsugineum]
MRSLRRTDTGDFWPRIIHAVRVLAEFSFLWYGFQPRKVDLRRGGVFIRTSIIHPLKYWLVNIIIFGYGSLSYIPNFYSSSSSSDDDDNMEIINSLDNAEQAIHRAIANNNAIIQYFLNQQSNDVAHDRSVRGRTFIHRDRESAHDRLFNDYFSETPLYNDAMFRRRYRMSRSLFLRIINAVENHDNYFTQKRDTIGRLGLSSLQKGTAVLRMLAYGLPADATDEYVKIGESTALESMKIFCRAIVDIFSEQYLRSPTANDVARLLYIGEKRGFPGMLGIAPSCHYVIQGNQYNMGYYLADGIYPKWSTIVQTIHEPRGPKKKYFATQQEACRKDVERAFGVLQSRFAIVKGPARFWKKNVLHDIMTTCIILHNMIIDDERDLDAPIEVEREAPPPEVEIAIDENIRFQEFLCRYRQIKDKEAHFSLRNALIDHLWEKYTNGDV